jgi:hypothetical protein
MLYEYELRVQAISTSAVTVIPVGAVEQECDESQSLLPKFHA